MFRTVKGAAVYFCLITAFIACNQKTTRIDMDPLEFNAFMTPDGIKVDMMDPESLFDEGATAFEAGKFDEAARLFGLVLKKFPDSTVAKPALFNHGLALLKVGRPAQAAVSFRTFVKTHPGDADTAAAYRRLGEALLESGEWVEAEKVIRKDLEAAGSEKSRLAPTLEVELRARLCKALRKQNRFEEARNQMTQTLEIYDEHALEPEMKGNYFAGMAGFEGAETWHDLFYGIKFVLPTDRMEKDLTDKATLFMKAQSDYLRTVRLGNIFWSSKAGVRIGQLYEEFYDDIMNAEVPPGLTDDDLRLYLSELRRQARPLLEKAVDSYERNMAIARMYGAKDEWFTDMKSRLDRLKTLLKKFSDSSATRE
jgi:TolA-binding protein